MTFTYDPTKLQTDPATQVRLLLGDTVSGRGPRPNGRNFEDGEIAFFLSETGNDPYLAAALAAETLASEWASAADVAVGPRRERLGQISRQWERRAKRWRAMKGGAGARVYAAPIGHNDAYESLSTSGDYA